MARVHNIPIANPSGKDLMLRIEPWGEEFHVPPGHSYVVKATSSVDSEDDSDLEMELHDDEIVIHGWPGSTVSVFDGLRRVGGSSVSVPSTPASRGLMEPALGSPQGQDYEHRSRLLEIGRILSQVSSQQRYFKFRIEILGQQAIFAFGIFTAVALGVVLCAAVLQPEMAASIGLTIGGLVLALGCAGIALSRSPTMRMQEVSRRIQALETRSVGVNPHLDLQSPLSDNITPDAPRGTQDQRPPQKSSQNRL